MKIAFLQARWLCWTLWVALIVPGLRAVDYPPVRFMVPDPSQGIHLRRSVNLMRQSTDVRKVSVRVLLYGGILGRYDWWGQIERQLRTEYPSVNFEFRNGSITRHYSQHARKTAESDVYPFYPDLVVLFPAASYVDFTNLVENIRERTTADILVPNEHLAAYSTLEEETSSRVLMDLWRQEKIGSTNSSALWSYALLPQAAREFGFCLADIRTPWKQYLRDNKLAPTDLVPAWAEPGPQGHFLLAELLKPYFRPITGLPSVDPWDNERINTYVAGKEIRWRDGKLELDFKGNRVDAVVAEGEPEEVEVRIDGIAPSKRPELYWFTRANGIGAVPNPALLRASSTALPVDGETWTLQLRDIAPDGGRFRFTVSGSVTGPDGEGDSQFEFISKSGRLAINPEDWNVAWCARFLDGAMPRETEVQIRSACQGMDRFKPALAEDPNLESVVTLAQGLPNGPHHLELKSVSGRPAAIRAIRVYRPFLPPAATGTKRRR